MTHINIQKRRIAADICSCVDESRSFLHLEFTVPGVEKKDIHLKMNNDRYSLKADKTDVEYVSTGRFTCPVEIEKTEANYENGLLYINIPLKDPWENAYSVTIH